MRGAARAAGPGGVESIALVLGNRLREVPLLAKLHSRDDDLVFVRGVLKTHVMRLDDAGGGLAISAKGLARWSSAMAPGMTRNCRMSGWSGKHE